MRSSTLYIITTFCLLCFGCNTKKEELKIDISNLHKLSKIEAGIRNDTLFIKFHDDSFIYEPSYNALKAQVLLHKNYEAIIKHKTDNPFNHIVTFSYQNDRPENFARHYNLQQFENVVNYIKQDSIFHDYAYHITEKMDATDVMTMFDANSAINGFTKDTVDYITVLANLAKLDKNQVNNSVYPNRLRVMGRMVQKMGVPDLFSDKILAPDDFLKDLDFFLAKKGLEPIEREITNDSTKSQQ